MTNPLTAARQFAAASQLRSAIRTGEFSRPTAGQAPGFVQTNLVILPAAFADDFAAFCEANPSACPLVERTAPGDPEPKKSARGADLRTDVPRYRVFRHGRPDPHEPSDVAALWRDDLTSFLLGCSFTFERALIEAGLQVRHIDAGSNVPMYRTCVPCAAAGPFAGPLVVSMRPFSLDDVERVIAITSQHPRMHGAPLHVGDPAALGIADLTRPDFGDAVAVAEHEVPVFWACGVTPQLALAAARPDLAITHSPGCMFVTDLLDLDFRT